MRAGEADPTSKVTVDVERGPVRTWPASSASSRWTTPPGAVPGGLDDIGITLRDADAIGAFEAGRQPGYRRCPPVAAGVVTARRQEGGGHAVRMAGQVVSAWARHHRGAVLARQDVEQVDERLHQRQALVVGGVGCRHLGRDGRDEPGTRVGRDDGAGGVRDRDAPRERRRWRGGMALLHASATARTSMSSRSDSGTPVQHCRATRRRRRNGRL